MRRIVLQARNEIAIDDVDPHAFYLYSFQDNDERPRILIRNANEGFYFWRDPEYVTGGCSNGKGHESLTGAIQHTIKRGFQVYQ